MKRVRKIFSDVISLDGDAKYTDIGVWPNGSTTGTRASILKIRTESGEYAKMALFVGTQIPSDRIDPSDGIDPRYVPLAVYPYEEFDFPISPVIDTISVWNTNYSGGNVTLLWMVTDEDFSDCGGVRETHGQVIETGDDLVHVSVWPAFQTGGRRADVVRVNANLPIRMSLDCDPNTALVVFSPNLTKDFAIPISRCVNTLTFGISAEATTVFISWYVHG